MSVDLCVCVYACVYVSHKTHLKVKFFPVPLRGGDNAGSDHLKEVLLVGVVLDFLHVALHGLAHGGGAGDAVEAPYGDVVRFTSADPFF